MEDNVYCGIGKVPKNSKIGTMKQCADRKQIRYWGQNKVDSSILDSAKKPPRTVLIPKKREALLAVIFKNRGIVDRNKGRYEKAPKSVSEETKKEYFKLWKEAEKKLKVLEPVFAKMEIERRKKLEEEANKSKDIKKSKTKSKGEKKQKTKSKEEKKQKTKSKEEKKQKTKSKEEKKQKTKSKEEKKQKTKSKEEKKQKTKEKKKSNKSGSSKSKSESLTKPKSNKVIVIKKKK
jgi:hypothetical protein